MKILINFKDGWLEKCKDAAIAGVFLSRLKSQMSWSSRHFTGALGNVKLLIKKAASCE